MKKPLLMLVLPVLALANTGEIPYDSLEEDIEAEMEYLTLMSG